MSPDDRNDWVEGVNRESSASSVDATVRNSSASEELVVPGGWKIEGRISEPQETGEADVYRVSRSGEHRAAKVYKKLGDNAEAIKPSKDLLEVVRTLESRNVVRIYKHGMLADGRYYELMEFCGGTTLKNLIRQAITEDRLREIVSQLAEALHALHQKGITHRDLKPANVLIRSLEPMDVALADFGISCFANSQPYRGAQQFTLLYASPSQLVGGVATSDDWWSLGMVILEAMWREHPLVGCGNDRQVIQYRQANLEVEVPERFGNHWEKLCSGLLQTRAADRWGYSKVVEWISLNIISINSIDCNAECPKCEKSQTISDGTGQYECNDCGSEFTLKLQCPQCENQLEVKKWGLSECPFCSEKFDSWQASSLEPQEEIIDESDQDTCTDVECPHCGEAQSISDGTGQYECNDCGSEFTLTLHCPKCKNQLEVDRWGLSKCPFCSEKFDSWQASSLEPQEEIIDESDQDTCTDVECPHCGEAQSISDGTGQYECNDCGSEFTLTLHCPKCKNQLEVDRWGLSKCPFCSEKFDSWQKSSLEFQEEGIDESEQDYEEGELSAGEERSIFVVKCRWIPAGGFVMGSPASEKGRDTDEVEHEVVLSHGFFLAETECTQAQWELVMENNPSKFKRPDRPVEGVSWDEAVEFCRKLTKKQRNEGLLPVGWEWRLPTESEWEYGARAGKKGLRHGKLEAVAWWSDNSGAGTHVVGEKQANPWGLHDMMGNVWEWCSDWYGEYPTGSVVDPMGPWSGSGRVIRGGSWVNDARDVRSALRDWGDPGLRLAALGFRPVFSSVR